MSKLLKTVEVVNCGQEMVNRTKIIPLQGMLKELHKEQYEKLKASMLEYGFNFPVFVWENPTTREIKTVDGHQRLFTLEQMFKEGYNVPEEVPVCYLKAANEDDAKRLILVASSRYGKMTDEGFAEFLHNFQDEVNFDRLKTVIDLPDIDLSKFELGYVKEEEVEDNLSDVPPTHVKLVVHIPNDVYPHFMNQFDAIAKVFPGIKYEQEKL